MTQNPIFLFIAAHFTAILYCVYTVVFVFLSIWEYFAPRRHPTQPRLKRWGSNFSFYAIDTVLLASLSTAAITNLAYFTWKNGWGLLNHLPLSPWVQFFLSLVLLDLQVYALHVLYHKNPIGWRFHRVHHLDLDMDSSTGVLFHPFESLVSFIVRQPFVLLIGPSPLAVLVFDAFFILALFLTHANVRVWQALDRLLRLVFITPDMHRVHHSTDWVESNSNYGFSLSWWDYLFRTYRNRPAPTQVNMELGLSEFQTTRETGILRRLVFPFVKKRQAAD